MYIFNTYNINYNKIFKGNLNYYKKILTNWKNKFWQNASLKNSNYYFF